MRRLSGTDERGSTLVELLVVMTILGVVGGIAVSSSISGMQTSRHAQDRVQALAETQTVVERVGRELRAAANLHDVEPDRVDLDVVRHDRRLRFVYEIDGEELVELRQDFEGAAAREHDFDVHANDPDVEGSRVLLRGLAYDDMFTVHGGDGRELDLAGDDHLRDVRRITLRVLRDVGAGQDEREPIEVETTVWPRNSKDLDS